jgi:predicted secreted protein
MQRITNIIKKLDDERSRKIIFLSHCILNENTRYPGGAFTQGMVSAVVREIDSKGCGIVQLPCPEQKAWGGVLKKYMLLSYGLNNSGSWLNLFRGILLPLFISHTKWAYKKIARDTVKMIEDYKYSGFEVIGIVGVDGSPTCGISTCLDMKKSFDYCAGLNIESIDRNIYNKEMYSRCLKQGKGLFFLEMDKALKRKKIAITYYSHDLVREMNSEITIINF